MVHDFRNHESRFARRGSKGLGRHDQRHDCTGDHILKIAKSGSGGLGVVMTADCVSQVEHGREPSGDGAELHPVLTVEAGESGEDAPHTTQPKPVVGKVRREHSAHHRGTRQGAARFEKRSTQTRCRQGRGEAAVRIQRFASHQACLGGRIGKFQCLHSDGEVKIAAALLIAKLKRICSAADIGPPSRDVGAPRRRSARPSEAWAANVLGCEIGGGKRGLTVEENGIGSRRSVSNVFDREGV